MNTLRCDQPNCTYETKYPQVLGAHKRRIHGITGKWKQKIIRAAQRRKEKLGGRILPKVDDDYNFCHVCGNNIRRSKNAVRASKELELENER